MLPVGSILLVILLHSFCHPLACTLVSAAKWNKEFEDGNYLARWEVNMEEQKIYFHVSVATDGFVGFGISPIPGMIGADIVIGGVLLNGSSYFGVSWQVIHDHSIPSLNVIVGLPRNWKYITGARRPTGLGTIGRFRRQW